MGQAEEDSVGNGGQGDADHGAGPGEDPEQSTEHQAPEEQFLEHGHDDHREHGDDGEVGAREPAGQVVRRLLQPLVEVRYDVPQGEIEQGQQEELSAQPDDGPGERVPAVEFETHVAAQAPGPPEPRGAHDGCDEPGPQSDEAGDHHPRRRHRLGRELGHVGRVAGEGGHDHEEDAAQQLAADEPEGREHEPRPRLAPGARR